MSAEFLPVAVCADCALWAANRDESGASEEWKARVDQDLGDESGRTVREYVGTLIIESGDEAVHFSTSACHGCGDPLDGDRHDGWEPA